MSTSAWRSAHRCDARLRGATRPHKIRTIVSLNPVMVDGPGMSGGCRVKVGRRKFACVDGRTSMATGSISTT